jgi:Arc/MetJ-type ribon-helix-helix transcriptional regulator
MDEREKKEAAFSECLKEALRRWSESEEAYEAWLRERGLTRSMVGRAARDDRFRHDAGAGRALEAFRQGIDVRAAEGPSVRDGGDAETVFTLPPRAFRA